MYDYHTQNNGESLIITNLATGETRHFQGDEATIVLNDIDLMNITAVAPMYFSKEGEE